MTKGVVVKTLAAPAPPSTHAGGGASARKTSSLPSHWRRALARPGRRRHPPGLHHHAQRVRSARGAATAELAMVLPLLVAVTIGLVWLLAVASAQVRTVDAARETARALARGDDQATAVARGLAVAPEGSHVAVSRGRGEVRVTVTGRAEGPGGLFAHLPSPRLRAEAVAADEQDEVTP